MNSTERHWLVNLKPEGDGTARCAQVLGGDGVNGRGIDDVLNDAITLWPGQVLDVVGPDGRSYLLCSTPPWYAQQPGT